MGHGLWLAVLSFYGSARFNHDPFLCAFQRQKPCSGLQSHTIDESTSLSEISGEAQRPLVNFSELNNGSPKSSKHGLQEIPPKPATAGAACSSRSSSAWDDLSPTYSASCSWRAERPLLFWGLPGFGTSGGVSGPWGFGGT